MLFEPDRHEALDSTPWDASRAHQTVRSIVHDIEQQRGSDESWPVHPRDDEGDTPRTGFKTLYLGRVGVLWALWALQREGAVELTLDPIEGVARADAAYQAEPDAGTVVPSYFLGEAGILTVLWHMNRSATVADRLAASVRSNIDNPTNEALWGAPGTMLAAWHLWKATGEARWKDLVLDNVEHVWKHWLFDATAQCHLWTQDMYGKVVQYLGAGHGLAGNVYALLKCAALLDAPRRAELYERTATAFRTLAKSQDGAVNWPPGTYTPRPGGAQILMQWCHGAPGIVTALSDFPRGVSAELDALLVQAGQAIWTAGPLVKGYGLCHGTAGNGYAFLGLYERTGDPLWLDRARAFAVHAMGQQDRMRREHGRGRYTLWTGDAGLAVYLWDCIRARSGLPTLDIL